MKSFRDFIEYLDKSNKLVKVEKSVDPEYELTHVATSIHEKYKKASLFNNVKGSKFPVVSYVLSDREVIADGLNMDMDKMVKEWSEREEHKAPYAKVEKGAANEVINMEPNLFELPLGIHSQDNAGRYITGGIVIAKHPEKNVQNASYNRCQLVDKDKLHVRMMPPQDLGVYFEIAEELGQPLDIAIVIGAPVSLMFSAASKIPFERDEMEFAGALANEPMEVIKCQTNDVLVPANAEFVIEARVLPNVREEEGPFGEFTDSYVPVMRNHVVQVTAITHRKNPIYHDIFAGGKEDIHLLALPIESEVYNHIRKYANPDDIVGVLCTPFVFGCFISIKKQREDQPKSILLSALASYSWIKFAVIVDEDVDIHNAEDVFWAIQTRCCPDTGVMLVPGVTSYTREDVKEENIGKFAIDATAPLHKKHIYRRRTNPMEGKINLEDYLSKE